jgi:kynureninase
VELRHRVARALVTADIDLYELRAESISLEDIFLRLTGSDTDTEASALQQDRVDSQPAPPDAKDGE